MRRSHLFGGTASALTIGLLIACGSSTRDSGFDTTTPGEDAAIGFTPEGGVGFGGDGSNPNAIPTDTTRDPIDCNEAKTSKSYVGCDYWPTVTPNAVWSIFDYAVVVANTGANDATVTVTGPNSVNKQVTVPAGELKKIYLPWVTELKGGDATNCGQPPSNYASLIQSNGAYHLVSSTPVIVYQFNALEYKGAGGESPSGGAKDWSQCPGNKSGALDCFPNPAPQCFSYSNDASLLLPSTAMTGNYRVIGQHGWSEQGQALTPAIRTITATADTTAVTVSLSSTAKVVASLSGQAVPATNGSGKIAITLAKAGDVMQLVAESGSGFDFSGSIVQGDKPIQVISGVPCIFLPEGQQACDHIEETVLPAETLGKHYVIESPTGPKGAPVQHIVRLYGNKDGTTLTYAGTKPPKCPTTLSAGQVADCDLVTDSFEVTGNNEFAVATFMLAAQLYGDTKGDPDQTSFAAVEQFRTKYVFLAPNDYPVLWADITATQDADIQLDGAALTAKWTQIGAGPYGVQRVDLTKSGKDGAHTLTAKKAVGVQVIGFGDNTSFMYPAGLNLNLIAPPPNVPK